MRSVSCANAEKLMMPRRTGSEEEIVSRSARLFRSDVSRLNVTALRYSVGP